jgi:hypothetical protein
MKQYIDTTQDANGNALVGVSIEVDVYNTSSKATLYSDNGLTTLANPVTSDSTGQFSFFVADGDYTLKFTYNGTLYKTQSPVSIFDGAEQVTFTDSGSANAYAISGDSLEKAYRTGIRCTFKAANTNTTTSTLNYNSLGTKTIVTSDGSNVAAGAIVSGGIYTVEYDGTNFQIKNAFNVPTSDTTGSFTITLTGMSATTTGTVNYRIINKNTVQVWVASGITGTSNANTMTGTGVPSAIQPTTGKYIIVRCEDNTGFEFDILYTGTSGTWTFGKGAAYATSSYTTSGTKGFSPGVFSYTLD